MCINGGIQTGAVWGLRHINLMVLTDRWLIKWKHCSASCLTDTRGIRRLSRFDHCSQMKRIRALPPSCSDEKIIQRKEENYKIAFLRSCQTTIENIINCFVSARESRKIKGIEEEIKRIPQRKQFALSLFHYWKGIAIKRAVQFSLSFFELIQNIYCTHRIRSDQMSVHMQICCYKHPHLPFSCSTGMR